MRPLSMMGAFRIMGPAFLVSVALVDPGNWATSIEAGSKFGYELVWVVVASNLIAILLQTLAARLGIVTGKHLAQVCRESYPPQVCALLWVLCEISIVALDLTMVLGTAIGLNLLLGWPMLPCIVLTSLDALLLLLLVPAQGVKKSEALTVGLLAVVVACFLVDLVVSRPPLASVVSGLLPRLRRDSVYTAVSLLGANVMPHNFYLHSALVSGQAAKAAAAAAQAGFGGSDDGGGGGRRGQIRALCLYNFLDIGAALGVALVINVAVLLVSAATFHSAGVVVHTLQAAHDLMEQTLSSSIAPAAFGTALLCAGQLSTFTGTIAGQVVLQGFLNIHISTLLRRLITRTAAIIPAAVLQYVYGDRGTYKFLLIAQVVLALQLPVTLVPLIKATSSRQLMGDHASSRLLAAAAWGATGLVFLANLMLFVTQMLPEVSSGRGILDKDGPLDAWIDRVASLAYSDPLRAVGLVGLLVAASAFLALQLWMIVTPLRVDAAAAGAAGALSPAAAAAAAAAAAKPGDGEGAGVGSAGPWHGDERPSDSGDGRSGRGWFGLWFGGGGGGGGGDGGRGSQRGRRLGAAQMCFGNAGGGEVQGHSTAGARPSAGQAAVAAAWQQQQQQQLEAQQWAGYAAWSRGSAAAAADPFVAAAAAAAGAVGFGGGWVIPSSAIARVISSGPMPYDAGTAAANAALLPLPWRPRERYHRRRSGCFCSEGETGSDSGEESDNDSGYGDGNHTPDATGAISAVDAGAEVLIADRSHRSSPSSSAAANAAEAEAEALWTRCLSLPLTGRAMGSLAGDAAAADEAPGTAAAGAGIADQIAGALEAIASTAPAAVETEPAAGVTRDAVRDADLESPPPPPVPLTVSAAATSALLVAVTAADAGGGGGEQHAARPKHPVSRGTRPKFAKLLEDFWAVFYDAHGRPACGAREAPRGPQQQPQPQQQPLEAPPRSSQPLGGSAQSSQWLPPPPPPLLMPLHQGEQWQRHGRPLEALGRGGGGGGVRSRVGLRSLGGGGGEEGWDGGGGGGAPDAAASPPSSPLVCMHTEGSHLCMGCSQALFEAVRQCLWALEQLAGVEAAVWGAWPLQLVLPQDNQTFHYHRAVLLATRNADFPALQALCAGTYDSQVDQSRLLASTPLTQSASTPSPLPPPPSAAAAAAMVGLDVVAAVWRPELSRSALLPQATIRAPHGQQQQQQQQQQQEEVALLLLPGAGWEQGGDDSSNGTRAADWAPWQQPAGSQPRGPAGPPLAGAKGAAWLPTHRSGDSAVPGSTQSPSSAWDWADPPLSSQATGSGATGAEVSAPAAIHALAPAAAECAATAAAPPPPPRAAGPGFPTVSSWCLFGPAAFVSFGVWSVFTLAQWCTADSRPAHWGQYASVLNRLQGALRDARLDLTATSVVADGAVVAASAPLAAAAASAAAAPPSSLPLPLKGQPPPLQQHEQQQQQQQQQRGRQRGNGRGGVGIQQSRQLKLQSPQLQQQQQQIQQQLVQQQQQVQRLAVLPSSALRLCPEHLALLRWELLRQLEGMEAGIQERRGPADTAAGQVAFPKAKEIMASVMRRYRRRLGAAPAAAAAAASGGGAQLGNLDGAAQEHGDAPPGGEGASPHGRAAGRSWQRASSGSVPQPPAVAAGAAIRPAALPRPEGPLSLA